MIGISLPAFAASPPMPAPVRPHAVDNEHITRSGDAWIINFKDADLQTVIAQIAEITAENYVLPPNVTGKITIISQTPLKRSEVDDLLLSVLYINGFTVTPAGNTLVIQPSGDAKKNQSPVDTRGRMSGEAFIARVMPLKYANPNDILQAVQPLVSDFAVIKDFPDSSALLVADRADNVRKIAQIVAQLDTPEPSGVDAVKLQNSWVGNIMPLLEKLAPRELGEAGKPAVSPIRIVGDEHNNMIVLKGDAEARARLHALIERLDQASRDGDSVQVIPLHNIDAVKTAETLKDMFGGGASAAPVAAAGGTAPIAIPVSIKASASTNSLVVHGSPDIIGQIRRTVEQLDAPRPQVLIEAAIVEVSDDILGQLGVQFGGGQSAVKSGLVTTSLTAGGATALGAPPIGLAAFLQQINAPNSLLNGGGLTAAVSRDRFSALINALAANSHANLLSTPSITTLNNEEAKILVGQNVPFLTGSFAQATTNSGGVNPFNTIQRQDIGVTLKVTPQISEHNTVLLKVDQEVSSIAPTSVAGAADIITNKRTISTTILANNGQTVALGGLITDNKNLAKSKVPLLGDIPVIGLLFQDNQEEDSKSDLVVFLRPTVIATTASMNDVNMHEYNGIWELTLGEEAKDNPLTPEKLPPELDKLYAPADFAKPREFVVLPWLRH